MSNAKISRENCCIFLVHCLSQIIGKMAILHNLYHHPYVAHFEKTSAYIWQYFIFFSISYFYCILIWIVMALSTCAATSIVIFLYRRSIKAHLVLCFIRGICLSWSSATHKSGQQMSAYEQQYIFNHNWTHFIYLKLWLLFAGSTSASKATLPYKSITGHYICANLHHLTIVQNI